MIEQSLRMDSGMSGHTVGSQTMRVRRVYSIISSVAFTIAEELSIDGGPYQRLGNAEFSKTP